MKHGLAAAILFIALAALGGTGLGMFGLVPRVQAQGCPSGIPSAGNPQCIPPSASNSPYNTGDMASPGRPVHVNRFGSQAVDDNGGLSWAVDHGSADDAQSAAMKSCKARGGKKCQSLGIFKNQCLTHALNRRGDVFAGYDVSPRTAARDAIAACNRDTTDGYCRLASLPICTGLQYSKRENAAADRATATDLEAPSATLDKLQYWGAVGVSDRRKPSGKRSPSRCARAASC